MPYNWYFFFFDIEFSFKHFVIQRFEKSENYKLV